MSLAGGESRAAGLRGSAKTRAAELRGRAPPTTQSPRVQYGHENVPRIRNADARKGGGGDGGREGSVLTFAINLVH